VKIEILLVVFCAWVLVAGCTPMLNVSQDFDSEANFKGFLTYDLMSKEDVALSAEAEAKFGDRRQLIEEEMRKAVKAQMEAKGFKRVTSDPDILVAYYVGVRNEVFMSNYGMTYWQISGNVEVEAVQDGAMRIDFVNPDTKRTVWSGTGYGAVNRDPTEDMIRKNIDRSVKKIMDQYPPDKKSAGF
jgi:hypothetical protein